MRYFYCIYAFLSTDTCDGLIYVRLGNIKREYSIKFRLIYNHNLYCITLDRLKTILELSLILCGCICYEVIIIVNIYIWRKMSSYEMADQLEWYSSLVYTGLFFFLRMLMLLHLPKTNELHSFILLHSVAHFWMLFKVHSNECGIPCPLTSPILTKYPVGQLPGHFTSSSIWNF